MFKGLKDLIFVPDAPAPVQASVAAPVQQAQQSSLAQPIEMPIVDSVLDVATIQASIINLIEQEPGYDRYSRFANTNVALEKVITIEGTRLQAAQATTNFTRDQLLESLNTYQGVLANEAANFEAQYVASAQQAIQGLNDQAASIADQIQQLTGQLAQLSSQKESIVSDALTRTSELAKAKIDFNSVTQTITNRYTDVANKLQQYLSA